MAIAARAEQNEPVMDINTTPLIDVMLVLLIMFIITIPLQSHSVKVDLPSPQPPAQVDINPIKNEVVVTDAGQILWNGSLVDTVRLRQYLDLTQRLNPLPELHLQPAAQAPYARVDEVMAITKRAQVAKMGFVGNERFAQAF